MTTETEAETGAMRPQVKNRQEPPQAGRGKEEIVPSNIQECALRTPSPGPHPHTLRMKESSGMSVAPPLGVRSCCMTAPIFLLPPAPAQAAHQAPGSLIDPSFPQRRLRSGAQGGSQSGCLARAEKVAPVPPLLPRAATRRRCRARPVSPRGAAAPRHCAAATHKGLLTGGPQPR